MKQTLLFISIFLVSCITPSQSNNIIDASLEDASVQDSLTTDVVQKSTLSDASKILDANKSRVFDADKEAAVDAKADSDKVKKDASQSSIDDCRTDDYETDNYDQDPWCKRSLSCCIKSCVEFKNGTDLNLNCQVLCTERHDWCR